MTDSLITPDRWHHDLKNQLGIVVGFAELLLNEMEPGDRHHADVQEIHTAARRALDLLSQVAVPPEAGEDEGP